MTSHFLFSFVFSGCGFLLSTIVDVAYYFLLLVIAVLLTLYLIVTKSVFLPFSKFCVA